MALKLANQFAYLSGSSGTLTPDAGEAFRVKNIINLDTSAANWLEIEVARTSLFYLPNTLPDLCLFGSGAGNDVNPSIFEILRAAGIDMSIPVPEGEDFVITPSSGTISLAVIYDILDAADIKPSDPNGPESRERLYFAWGTNGSDSGLGGVTIKLDSSLNPDAYPDWPFEDTVAGGQSVEWLGMLGSPFQAASAGAATQHSSKLLLTLNRRRLFTEDSDGLPFDGTGASTSGDGTHYDPPVAIFGFGAAQQRGRPLLFPSPIKLQSGDELVTQITLADDSATALPANGAVFGHLFRISPAK